MSTKRSRAVSLYGISYFFRLECFVFSWGQIVSYTLLESIKCWLIRLNFYSKIFLRKLHFQRTHYQYGAYFGRYYAPFLFVFGIVFVVLAAPQVEMAVEQVISNPVYDIWLASRVFCILAVIFCALSTLALAALWVHKIAAEWHFAIKSHFSKANSQHHSSDEWGRKGLTRTIVKDYGNTECDELAAWLNLGCTVCDVDQQCPPHPGGVSWGTYQNSASLMKC